MRRNLHEFLSNVSSLFFDTGETITTGRSFFPVGKPPVISNYGARLLSSFFRFWWLTTPSPA